MKIFPGVRVSTSGRIRTRPRRLGRPGKLLMTVVVLAIGSSLAAVAFTTPGASSAGWIIIVTWSLVTLTQWVKQAAKD